MKIWTFFSYGFLEIEHLHLRSVNFNRNSKRLHQDQKLLTFKRFEMRLDIKLQLEHKYSIKLEVKLLKEDISNCVFWRIRMINFWKVLQQHLKCYWNYKSFIAATSIKKIQADTLHFFLASNWITIDCLCSWSTFWWWFCICTSNSKGDLTVQ